MLADCRCGRSLSSHLFCAVSQMMMQQPQPQVNVVVQQQPQPGAIQHHAGRSCLPQGWPSR